MTEAAAAAAGGAAGGAAGKKVSDGITAIFQKVDQSASKAAEAPAPKSTPKVASKQNPVASGSQSPVFETGPGVPKGSKADLLVPPPPPPPPLKQTAVSVPRPVVAVAPAPEPVAVPAPPPPPPPPQATPEDLRKIALGLGREELLKVGEPAARISMYDDGHFVEQYRYMSGDITFGLVTLSDGAVSAVQVR